jgi:solute carrier family 25 (mitochondrial carnitine/acylcarnitine transporter), member 20/29
MAPAGGPSPAGTPSAPALEPAKKATSDLANSLRALVAGGVGGVCAVLTGHPFDLVKVNLQTAEKGAYNGAMDVVRKIVAQRGAMVRLPPPTFPH